MSTVEIVCQEHHGEPPTTRQVTAIPTSTPGLAVTPACFRFADDLAKLTDWTATDPERRDGFTTAYCELTARHGGRTAYEVAEEATA